MSTNFAALPACRALTMGKHFGAMICELRFSVFVGILTHSCRLGEYLMFQTHLGSAYYPACVAGITSTGMVRVEWYKDNIYEQTDEPAETDFVCSKQECADTAAQEPEGKYDRVRVRM
jgi:hypothetical protein